MSLVYAGIGSRKTPKHICEKFSDLAYLLSERLCATLRTGGAVGADESFIVGADANNPHTVELYLPWEGYNDYYNGMSKNIPDWTFKLAEQNHDYWNDCGPGARKMHARNCQIILGEDGKSPVDFIVCYTDGGKIIGGTGMALRLARKYEIPVYNFGIRDYSNKILEKYS